MTNIRKLVHTVSVIEVASNAQIRTQVQGVIERQEDVRTEVSDLDKNPKDKLAI